MTGENPSGTAVDLEDSLLDQTLSIAGGTYRITLTEEEPPPQTTQPEPEPEPHPGFSITTLPSEQPVPEDTPDLTVIVREPAPAVAPTVPLDVRDLWNVSDLMAVTGRTGEAVTAGWGSATDGAGMTWEITDAHPPKGPARWTAVPTADGRWAAPVGLPTSSRHRTHPAAAADMIRRARTFMDEGGATLVWDSTRRGPGLSDTPVHSTTTAPYPVTCSHLTGMVLAGWEWSSTTYVQDLNVRTGWWSPMYAEMGRAPVWQAHRLARFLFSEGRLWLTGDPDTLAPGDVIFLSHPDPEQTWDRVRNRSLQPYFGNVYHAAIYLGDGRILQSTGPTTPTGVWETDLSSVVETLTWAGRPAWVPPTYPTVVVGGVECPVQIS